MAFGFTTGTAANMAAFFAALEAFLIARGWVLVAGGGTTDIVYTSTGEGAAFTKLYIRIWQDLTNTHRINFRVQDDAAGTHNTQDATYGYMSALNVQFEYWFCGDLDCIFITVKGITAYSGAWLGAMIPAVIDDANEEYYMLSMNPENSYSYAGVLQYLFAKVLRNAAGAWNQIASVDTIIYAGSDKNPLDGGICVPASRAYLSDKEVYGNLKFFAGPLRKFPGGNAEDIYDSGEAGSAREWLIFGSGETRWAMLRVGPQPTNLRGATADYFTARGVANNWNDVFSIIERAAAAAGWTIDNHPGGGRRFFSTGELGTETIYCWLKVAGNLLYYSVQDDAGGTHSAGSAYNYTSFPYDIFCGADRDCILFTLDKGTGPPNIPWMGRAITSYLDEAAVGDEYKLVAGHGETGFRCLRQPDGAWSRSIYCTQTNPGMRYRCYSPQNNDGSYIAHWPIYYWGFQDILFGLKHICYIFPSGVSMYNYDLLQMDNGDLVFYRTNNLGHRAA